MFNETIAYGFVYSSSRMILLLLLFTFVVVGVAVDFVGPTALHLSHLMYDVRVRVCTTCVLVHARIVCLHTIYSIVPNQNSTLDFRIGLLSSSEEISSLLFYVHSCHVIIIIIFSSAQSTLSVTVDLNFYGILFLTRR